MWISLGSTGPTGNGAQRYVTIYAFITLYYSISSTTWIRDSIPEALHWHGLNTTEQKASARATSVASCAGHCPWLDGEQQMPWHGGYTPTAIALQLCSTASMHGWLLACHARRDSSGGWCELALWQGSSHQTEAPRRLGNTAGGQRARCCPSAPSASYAKMQRLGHHSDACYDARLPHSRKPCGAERQTTPRGATWLGTCYNAAQQIPRPRDTLSTATCMLLWTWPHIPGTLVGPSTDVSDTAESSLESRHVSRNTFSPPSGHIINLRTISTRHGERAARIICIFYPWLLRALGSTSATKSNLSQSAAHPFKKHLAARDSTQTGTLRYGGACT